MGQLTGKTPGAIERAVENLVTILVSLLPGDSRRRFYSGPVDALTAYAVLVALGFVGAKGLMADSLPGVTTLFLVAGLTAFSAALTLLASIVLNRPRAEETAVRFLWAMVLGAGLAVLVALGLRFTEHSAFFIAVVVAGILPAVLNLLSMHGPLRGGVITLVAALPGVALTYELTQGPSAVERGIEAAQLPDTEDVFARQRDLLLAETGMKPGAPGKPEIFAVLGAGFPYEGVFAREVAAVEALLNQSFAVEGRIASLINDDAAPIEKPLLNRTNLRLALAQVGARMNEEDILFLYLTSHGAPGKLSTEFYPLITRDILPEDVSGALTQAGIGNAIIVISACYSGSFLDSLAAPGRLILTAARADRSSFGCSDKAEWTEWGRAFFEDAWPQVRDPRQAALLARDLVARREADGGYEPSEPQIFEGANIGPVIDRWLETLD